VVGYYADWTSGKLSPQSIPYSKLTHINYAFAVLSQNYTPTFQTQSTLQQVVQLAHSNHVKVLLSIGGWTGSQYFSAMCASATNRHTFITATLALVKQFNLDGVDIDWEYPGKAGDTCNVFTPNDSANYKTLLQELRSAFGPNLEITAAASITPWVGTDGQPMSDVSAYASLLDRVSIMAYDINGIWSKKTGPNAPLAGSQSVQSAIKAWTAAKFPASRLVLGLPLYGRAVTTTDSNMSQYGGSPAEGVPISSTCPQGDQDDAPWADVCAGGPAVMSGVWQWRLLRQQGVLTSPTTAGQGWTRGVDSQSSTPWLYNANTKMFISYDDPSSIALKASAAKCNGLNGLMSWDLHQDNGELMDAAHSGWNGAHC